MEMAAPILARRKKDKIRRTQRIGARSQGAEVMEEGVRYRTWSEHDRVEVLIVDQRGEVLRVVPMESEAGGYFSALDKAGRAGDLYRYRLSGAADWPDPASRWQP